MVTIIRDRIQALHQEGFDAGAGENIRPTMDYDARYGAEKGFGTTDQFVEAVYKSLGGK